MQNNEREDPLVALTEKLNALSPSISEFSIYRVHNELREVNKKAYEPVLVSIGPYHRGNEKLRMMEEYKLRYLRRAIQRRNHDLEYYLSAMRSLVEEARKCYAEHVHLDVDEFAEMLVIDSCFVVEVIREFWGDNNLARKMEWMVISLQRDLMLFENQLPFFVVLKMLDLIGDAPNDQQQFIYSTFVFFADIFNCVGAQRTVHPKLEDYVGRKRISHLLELIHDIWLRNYQIQRSNQQVEENRKQWRSIPCASKLIEAGIKFEKAEEGLMFDITFNDGVISLPHLRIDDRTECFLRNLIAYEQYNVKIGRVFVTYYVSLLDNLIYTSKDVEILSKSGIVDSWLGGDNVVSDLFTKIMDSTLVFEDFRYADLCNRVNDYYNKKMNRWLAKLKKNYLNSPWAVISVVAAMILLVLAVAQTVAAIISI